MKDIKKNLEQRDKAELIDIIQNMLRLEPDLQWLLTISQPASSSEKATVNTEVFRQQVLAAMAAGEPQPRYKLGKVEKRLAAIKAIADEYVKQENYVAALTIYEVLVSEIIKHFNDYGDEYIAFSVTLMGCIDGLDSCFAGEEDNPELRLRVLQTLFAIYRFYTDTGMDLDEDIPGLLVGNSNRQERQQIANWVNDALARGRGYNAHRYQTLLSAIEKADANR